MERCSKCGGEVREIRSLGIMYCVECGVEVTTGGVEEELEEVMGEDEKKEIEEGIERRKERLRW